MLDDPFKDVTDTITSPARDCFDLTPDDVTELDRATKAIYVGEGGDISLRALDSEADVTFTNVPTGSIIPVRLRALRATGTSASNILGLV